MFGSFLNEAILKQGGGLLDVQKGMLELVLMDFEGFIEELGKVTATAGKVWPGGLPQVV